VKVYPGQGVPVDGVVIFGKGLCNEAMLTGESRPVPKEIGALMFGGSILIQGNIILKVTKTAENSSINQIIKLVEGAQNARAPIQGLADRISKYFVPIVILLTIVAWIIWFIYTYSDYGIDNIVLDGMSRFQFAFSFGISTLVIACPCALGLATPTAVMVGTGVAASHGILIKGGDVLEKISAVKTIVFDKTGTLTSGQPVVRDLISIHDHFKLDTAHKDKNFLLFMALLSERQSEHPLARAIVKKIQNLIPAQIEELGKLYKVKEFKNRDGEGVVAQVMDVK
jgi:Cu+-exporting ATPase